MVSMNIAARNHCSRPMARHLHGHNVCAEISPKALPRLNFQVKHSGKFGLGDLHKRVHEVSERVRSGLEPAMAGLGLKYLSAAGAIAAVTAAVKNFATGARDLTYMSRQTGLAVNTLRYFQDTIAPKINSSAQTMSA